MTAMTPYQQMIRAFQIFAEYPGEQGVAFHHDEAYAGPEPEIVSDDHVIELASLGWHASQGEGAFYSFNR
jgi:hypothetical protein